MEHLYAWIEDNLNQMFDNFMNSKPTYEQLLYVHKWYNPEKYQLRKFESKDVYAISANKYKMAMFNMIEKKLIDHKNRVRNRQFIEHNYKLFKSKTFEEKLLFFNNNIESLIKELTMNDQNTYANELR